LLNKPMKTSLLELTASVSTIGRTLNKALSFRRFISYLETRIASETTIKKEFFQFVHDKLTANPAFLEVIDPKDTGKFKEQLDLIYSIMLPQLADEKQMLWALSTVMDPSIFYGTSAFYNLLTNPETGELSCSVIREEESNVGMKQKIQVIYSLILNRLYNLDLQFKNDMVISLNDDATRLPKFYKINIDTSFIDVFPVEELPQLTPEMLDFKEATDWAALTNLIPLNKLRFEGFSVITLTDITSEYTVERLKNVILDQEKADSKSYFRNISESLKTLIGSNDIEFGLLPVLRVNSKIVFSNESYAHSMVMKHALENGMDEVEFQNMAEEYFVNPELFILNDISPALGAQDHFTQLLIENGVKSYALLPVYHDNHIAGVLEVYTGQDLQLTEKLLSKLNVALPLVAKILQNNINDFQTKVDDIIKDKFTSIQPSVQWKFKEVAWHYLRDNSREPQNNFIERIQFKNVFPLYGAIDIRNSTIERNKALSEDLITHFKALIDLIVQIKKHYSLGLLDEMIFKCEKWIRRISDYSIDHEEMKVNDFFEYEVEPFLKHFRDSCPELAYALEEYDDVTNENSGDAFANRRALETSMQKINSALNMYLDLFKNQIQESYPTYFEKFRTDGVEYDIYIGQSIAPQKPFNNLYLKNIRLWQLTSMAAIAKITHALLPKMEKKLETTQLIFINHGSIDISFRDDERRFDVEGAYNIRYHVIKKRIDKVHIAGTDERLTQPGKIAMVYFNNKEADEYVEYIRYLQEQGLLTYDLEYLELEELQGVTGLKALRVGINLEGNWKQSLEIALLDKQTAL
jgi:hypothetical protein